MQVMSYIEQDNAAICDEQKATFNFIFENVDLTKIVFVGGVADYINLRDYYIMPVHDLDIVYQNDNTLTKITQLINFGRYICKFYEFGEMQIMVAQHVTNEKRVHIDFIKRNFFYGSIVTSELLGHQIQHSSFEAMKKYHNEHNPKLTSHSLGVDYELRRLYKRSEKASLYNLVSYKKEKQLKVAANG